MVREIHESHKGVIYSVNQTRRSRNRFERWTSMTLYSYLYQLRSALQLYERATRVRGTYEPRTTSLERRVSFEFTTITRVYTTEIRKSSPPQPQSSKLKVDPKPPCRARKLRNETSFDSSSVSFVIRQTDYRMESVSKFGTETERRPLCALSISFFFRFFFLFSFLLAHTYLTAVLVPHIPSTQAFPSTPAQSTHRSHSPHCRAKRGPLRSTTFNPARSGSGFPALRWL